jgi:methyl-accepting chemotaxis protein-2 (aspartate sensor receptor)
VVETMHAISGSSSRIADIVGVIDGIAFQTNILALNAAVEAARAGEQGKGFAVVASEVRTLAQRSAAAAKEIKQLIEDSVQKVGKGSEQVGSAGATMREIVESVQRVAQLMGEISAASDEQATGIDQVTQQNAALVEEAAAAAGALEEQARQLAGAVSVFKLPGGQVIDAPAARLGGVGAPQLA